MYFLVPCSSRFFYVLNSTGIGTRQTYANNLFIRDKLNELRLEFDTDFEQNIDYIVIRGERI